VNPTIKFAAGDLIGKTLLPKPAYINVVVAGLDTDPKGFKAGPANAHVGLDFNQSK
jgi:hypothetical protein